MFLKNFQDKDIYTITGHYIGKVKDIILNLKTGDISKISLLRTTVTEKQNDEKGIFEKLLTQFEIPEETPQCIKKELVTIEYSKIISIGDIIIVNI